MRDVLEWLQERLLLGRLIPTRELLIRYLNHPVRKHFNWLEFFGFVTAFLLIMQAFTGILLAVYYKPTSSEAYQSVQRIMDPAQVTLGPFVRGLHYWAAQAIVVAVGLHVLRVFYVAAYKRPRELTWLTGVALFGMVVGFAFTGYLLPWDQESFWATMVGTAMANYVPLTGQFLLLLLRGGDWVTGETLTRFYAIHVLALPATLLLLFGLHFYLVNVHGMSQDDELAEIPPARGSSAPPLAVATRFWPRTVFQMSVLALLSVAVLSALATWQPAPLGAAADPLNKAHYIPCPQWYFLWIFQILKVFPGRTDVLGILGVPLATIVIMMGLPFFDRNPAREPRRRPVALGAGGATLVAVAVLSYLGAIQAPSALVTQGQVVAQPSFARDIQPIFTARCAACHIQQQLGGLNLSSYQTLMTTGSRKPVVKSGDPAGSLLYQMVSTGQMPLGSPPLPEVEIENIKNWIAQGAKDN